MLIEHIFDSIHERLEKLQQEIKNAAPQKQEDLKEEFAHILNVSEKLGEQWLDLQEKIRAVQEAWAATNEKPSEMLSTLGYLTEETEYAFRKGQGYFDLFLFEEAGDIFEDVLQIDPDIEIARLYLAYSYLFTDADARAEKEFRLLLETTEHPIVQGVVFHGLGYLAAKAKRYGQAVQCFKTALELFPLTPDTRFNLAIIHYLNGEYKAAVRELETCKEHDDEDWETLLFLARCYERTGQKQKAVRQLREILKECSNPAILREAARFCEEKRWFDEAMECYRCAYEHHRDHAWVWHGLGWNLWMKEQAPAAVQWLKKAISLAPDELDYLFSLGWISFQKRDWEQAERCFTHILEKDRDHPLAHAGIAELCMRKDEWEKARRHVRSLQQSDDERLQQLADRLWQKWKKQSP